jgi:tRNA(fMet)-specific endonuclease VapC
MGAVADTSFLIGLWRQQSWALEFGEQLLSEPLYLPWVVLGEFRHGARAAGHEPELVADFLDQGIPFMEAADTIAHYAELAAELQEAGIYRQTNQNDLWIAASARALGFPLVTRNERHYGRMLGIELILPDVV